MRIVGGSLGGRRFSGPPGRATRPTAERVREAVASALEARDVVVGATVLDLFAGTGALGFEMLSRGADTLLAVDRDRRVVGALARSAEELGLSDRAVSLSVDLLAEPASVADRLRATADRPFSLVFADPPYAQIAAVPDLLRALDDRGALTQDVLIVLEHSARAAPVLGTGLASVKQYKYGDTSIQLVETTP